MIHRRILDVARDNPDAPIDDLASLISGATPGIVERVLDEYGDPSSLTDQPDPDLPDPARAVTDPPDADGSSVDESNADDPESERTDPTRPEPRQSTAMSKSERTASTDERVSAPEFDATVADDGVDEKQLQTLRAIYEHPDASQRQLADILGVSHSTISHRLSELDGFEWENRWNDVKNIFENEADRDADIATPEFGRRLEQLEERIECLSGSRSALFGDPDLAHRIVHACMQSENISEDEELRIVQAAIRSDR